MAKKKAKSKKKKNAGAFAKCVASVKKKGGAVSPRAVCAEAGRRKYGQAEMTRRSIAGKKKAAKKRNYSPMPSSHAGVIRELKAKGLKYKGLQHLAKERKRKKKNPAAASDKAYQGFHGRPSEELITVEKQVHFHKHLAGAGKLEFLKVLTRDGRYIVTLTNFGGAVVAFNEKRNQLFIEGGKQSVDLKQFGITVAHEMETLGSVKQIGYFTRKDHLRPEDGGTAIYVHTFKSPRPDLIYRTIDKSLEFSGGVYTIPDEGIDH